MPQSLSAAGSNSLRAPDRSLRVVATRDRDAPATWGQQFMWEVSHRLDGGGAQLAISVTARVPIGTSPRRVDRSVQALTARHDALRTHFHGRSLSTVRQHVRSEIDVPVFDVALDDIDDLHDVLDDLTRELREPGFDPESDVLVRVGVLSVGDAPHSVVLVLSHLVVDGWSLRQLGHELGVLLGGGMLLGTAPQPEGQAMFELSADGGELNRRALDHQQRVFRSLSSLTPRVDLHAQDSPRFQEGVLVCRRAYAAAEDVAKTARVTVPTVFLSSVVRVLTELSGSTCLTVLMWTHNRLRREARSTVGQYTQVVPIQFETRSTDVHSMLRETQRTVARGIGHGMYSPAGAARIREPFEAMAGAELPLGFRFNHVQAEPDSEESAPRDAEGKFSWRMTADQEDVVASFTMLERERALSLYADTRFIPSREIVDVLRRCTALLEGMRSV